MIAQMLMYGSRGPGMTSELESSVKRKFLIKF